MSPPACKRRSGRIKETLMSRRDKHQRFYGYTIVAACFLIQGIGVGSFIAYGVFFPSLLEAFGWSRTMLSGASSMV